MTNYGRKWWSSLVLLCVLHVQAFPTNREDDHQAMEANYQQLQSMASRIMPLFKHRRELNLLQDVQDLTRAMDYFIKKAKLAKVLRKHSDSPNVEYDDFSEVVPYLQMATMTQGNRESIPTPSKRYRKWHTVCKTLITNVNLSLISVGIDIPDYISTGGKFDAIKHMSDKMKAMGKR